MNSNKNAYRITTDTMSDLPDSFLAEHEVETISLSYLIDGKSYDKTNALPPEEFFSLMRRGTVPTSSQLTPSGALKVFESLIEKYDQDIVHISFSSALSGSHQSALIGAKMAMELHPERRVVVLDPLVASLGQGMLVVNMLEMRDKGYSLDELVDWINETAPHICHLFTVEDLIYLYRGGRVSRTKAFVSGVLDIKPMMHLSNEGQLIPRDKVRGRKKSLLALVDGYDKQVGKYRDPKAPVYICHGDCLEDAEFVRDQLKQRHGIENFLINFVGSTIGLHTGPGLVAIFFMGDYR